MLAVLLIVFWACPAVAKSSGVKKIIPMITWYCADCRNAMYYTFAPCKLFIGVNIENRDWEEQIKVWGLLKDISKSVTRCSVVSSIPGVKIRGHNFTKAREENMSPREVYDKSERVIISKTGGVTTKATLFQWKCAFFKHGCNANGFAFNGDDMDLYQGIYFNRLELFNFSDGGNIGDCRGKIGDYTKQTNRSHIVIIDNPKIEPNSRGIANNKAQIWFSN
jgi:hypothetical protein